MGLKEILEKRNIKKKYPYILFWKIREWDIESLTSTERSLNALSEFNSNLIGNVFCLEIDLKNSPPPNKDGIKGCIDLASFSKDTRTIKLYKDYLHYSKFVHESVHLHEYNLRREYPTKFAEFMVDWYNLVHPKAYLGANWINADDIHRIRHGFIRLYSSKDASEDMATLVQHIAEGKKLPNLTIFEKKKNLLLDYGFLKSN